MNRGILGRIVRYLCGAIVLGSFYILGHEIGSSEIKEQYTWGFPNLPDCQLTEVARYPSAGGTDIATLLKRDCGRGEQISYFVKLDIAARKPAARGWRRIVELENDQPPMGDPAVVWIKERTVQVKVSTRTLSGTLIESDGEDIEIVRLYQPRQPKAFPNWR